MSSPTREPASVMATHPTSAAERGLSLACHMESMGAKNIWVNPQQITVRNGQRVGINRPDHQVGYDGCRYHVEYETPTSGRGTRTHGGGNAH